MAALATASCAVEERVREADITVYGEEEIEAILPGGATVNGWDEYEAAVAAETPPIAELGTYSITVSDASPDAAAGKGLNLGNFRLSLQADATYLGGCINRKFLHIKIVVESAKIATPIAEIHLLGWFDGTKPCVGFMNTGFIGYGWCQKFCWSGSPKSGVTKGIASGLTAAGVGSVAAAVLARLLAPVALSALAL
jgi:hypothetical protein